MLAENKTQRFEYLPVKGYVAESVLFETEFQKNKFLQQVLFVERLQWQLFVEEFLHLSIDNFQSKQQVFFGRVK